MATIKQQLAARVSVAGPPSDWMTPLMWASAKGQEAAVRVLLDSGANPNARNEVGITALWEAARTGRLAIIKELVAHHADVNARVIPRVGGDTPLMCAADFGHADVAKFLVQDGADPRAKNAKGQTAAQLARSSGFAELASWLTLQGNSPTTRASSTRSITHGEHAQESGGYCAGHAAPLNGDARGGFVTADLDSLRRRSTGTALPLGGDGNPLSLLDNVQGKNQTR